VGGGIAKVYMSKSHVCCIIDKFHK